MYSTIEKATMLDHILLFEKKFTQCLFEKRKKENKNARIVIMYHVGLCRKYLLSK